MTLIVAICTDEEEEGQGLVISSDSQATVGPVTYRTNKIFPVIFDQTPLALIAGSGDSAIVKKTVDLCKKTLITKCEKEWKGNTPTLEQLEQTIPEIEISLIKKISTYKIEKVKNLTFNLILGGVSPAGESSLYVFDHRGIAQPVHDDPGFACIGSGFYLGGDLLLQQFYERPIDWVSAAELAAYVINQVSRVDAAVGPFEGESWYFRLEDKEPSLGSLSFKGFKKVQRECTCKQEALKYVWELCRYLPGEEPLRIIKKAVKEYEKSKKSKKSES